MSSASTCATAYCMSHRGPVFCATDALSARRSLFYAVPRNGQHREVVEHAITAALRDNRSVLYVAATPATAHTTYLQLLDSVGVECRVRVLSDTHGESADVTVADLPSVMAVWARHGTFIAGFDLILVDPLVLMPGRRDRGAWELIAAAAVPGQQLVVMAFNIANAELVADWLLRIRPDMQVCIHDAPPAETRVLYSARGQFIALFEEEGLAGNDHHPQLNEAFQLATLGLIQCRDGRFKPMRRYAHAGITRYLLKQAWVPAIFFTYSQKQIYGIANHIYHDMGDLVSPQETNDIQKYFNNIASQVKPHDFYTREYASLKRFCEAGIGILYPSLPEMYKECVEALFQRGLLRIVIASAAIIEERYIQAPCVIVDRLPRLDPTTHRITFGQHLSRFSGCVASHDQGPGILIICHQEHIPLPLLADLIHQRIGDYAGDNRVGFTFNPALLDNLSAHQWGLVYRRSFTRYIKTLKRTNQLEQVREHFAHYATYRAHLYSTMGDYQSYWSLRQQLVPHAVPITSTNETSILDLQPGDVIALDSSEKAEWAVVVERTSYGKVGLSLNSVTTKGQIHRITSQSPNDLVEVVGSLTIDEHPAFRKTHVRKTITAELNTLLSELAMGSATSQVEPHNPNDLAVHSDDLQAVYTTLQAHPVHQDPEIAQLDDMARTCDRILHTIAGLTSVIDKSWDLPEQGIHPLYQFMDDAEYLDATRRAHPNGVALQHFTHPKSPLILKAIQEGIVDHLNPAELAAWVSLFTSPVPHSHHLDRYPLNIPIALAIHATKALDRYFQHRYPAWNHVAVQPLLTGMVIPTWLWAQGKSLRVAMKAAWLPLRAFEETMHSTITILHVISKTTTGPVATQADLAIRMINRGIVSWAKDATSNGMYS